MSTGRSELHRHLDADVLTFGTTARVERLNKADTLTTISKQMPNRNEGTDFDLVFETLQKPYDRIFILSDEQAWVGYSTPARTGSLAAYKSVAKADPHVWSIDLRGYGTLQFPEHRVYALAGFSEKMFDIMPLMEAGPDGLVRSIEAVEL